MTKKNLINRDHMMLADPKPVGHASMTVIDRLQDYSPTSQVLASGMVFLLLCKRYGVLPQTVFDTTQNMWNGAAGKHPELRAVESYLGEEI